MTRARTRRMRARVVGAGWLAVIGLSVLVGGHRAGLGAVVGMGADTNMSQLRGMVSHHEREIAELRANRKLTAVYRKAAMESRDDRDQLAAGLLAHRGRNPRRVGGGGGRRRHQAGVVVPLPVIQRQLWTNSGSRNSGDALMQNATICAIGR